MPDEPVPYQALLEMVSAAGGPVMVVGTTDTGKSTLVSRLARDLRVAGGRPAVIEADVGQSEFGPSGMMDLLEPGDGQGEKAWRGLAHWYIGSASPYAAPAQCVAGVRRLADRAGKLGLSPILVDTTGFVSSSSGLALKTAKHDALVCGLIVAIQSAGELERWLRTLGTPVARVERPPETRTKPDGLRSARRANRLANYFRDAPPHRISLLEWALRGTRLGLGEPLPPLEHASLSDALGCRVMHAERAGRFAALWTLGPSRRGLERASEVLRVDNVITLDAAVWEGRSVGFIGRDGFCLAQGVVEAVDWTAMAATVRAPLYGLAEAVCMAVGTMRHRTDGTRLTDVSPQDS